MNTPLFPRPWLFPFTSLGAAHSRCHCVSPAIFSRVRK